MVDQLYSEDYCDDDLELIELTEADIIEEGPPDLLVERLKPPQQAVEDPWSALSEPVVSDATVAAKSEDLFEPPSDVAAKDPLMTSTLAELYVSQGFVDKALDIYNGMLASNPDNSSIAARITELERQVAAAEKTSAAVVQPVGFAAAAAGSLESGHVSDSSVSANASVAVLEGWLENIRRLRECR